MTTLRWQAVQLVQQVPEDQLTNTIQYLHSFVGKVGFDRFLEREGIVSPKLKAFGELESMLRSVPDLDYKKELEDARDEKYGRSD